MAIEDFTTFDENDSTRYSKTSSVLTVTGLNRTDDNHYVAKSYGASHFGDFTHYIDLNVSSSPDESTGLTMGSCWGVGNYENDIYYFATNEYDCIHVIVSCDDTASQYFLRLRIQDGATSRTDDSTGLTEGTTYYLKIVRSSTTVTCYIYSDASRETLVDSITETCANTSWEYVYASNSQGVATSRQWSGTISNLDLNEAVTVELYNLSLLGVGR